VTELPPAPKIPSNAYQRVNMIWGIESFTGQVLSTSASIGIGEMESNAEAIWDPTFDLLDEDAQLHLDYVWTRLLNSSLIMPELQMGQSSFIYRWKQFAIMRTGSFPVPRSRASDLLIEFMEYPAYKNEQYSLGFHDDGRPKWVGFTLIASFDSDLPGRKLEPYFENWDHFMRQLNLDAPASINKGFQTGACWVRMKVEVEFITGVIWSSFLSISCVFISLCVFTANIRLALLACITIVAIIITLLGLLIKTGLKLGAVEAISVQIVVGMSVDYLLHLGHSYTTSSFYSRFGRSRHAFLEIGAPVVSASATTAVSSFVLMFTTVQVLATVGKIIFFMTVVAILESLFLFIPLLMWLGPTGPKTVEDPEYENPHRLCSSQWWVRVIAFLSEGYCCKPLYRRVHRWLGVGVVERPDGSVDEFGDVIQRFDGLEAVGERFSEEEEGGEDKDDMPNGPSDHHLRRGSGRSTGVKAYGEEERARDGAKKQMGFDIEVSTLSSANISSRIYSRRSTYFTRIVALALIHTNTHAHTHTHTHTHMRTFTCTLRRCP
jgi:hypothetical protein